MVTGHAELPWGRVSQTLTALLSLAVWGRHRPPAQRLRGYGFHPGVGVVSLLQPCSCWGPQFQLGTATPTMEGSGFPAVVLPWWCLGPHGPHAIPHTQTHTAPAVSPKVALSHCCPRFSWHSLPGTTAPPSVPHGPVWLLSCLYNPLRAMVPSPLCLFPQAPQAGWRSPGQGEQRQEIFDLPGSGRDGGMEGWRDGCGRMEGWMDRCGMDGWRDGWIDDG